MLSEEDLDACAALIDELAQRAIERILGERPRPDQVATKTTPADWVTETDLAVERLVRDAIASRFPGHRIVGEEFGASGDEGSDAAWLIDPVDGTTNFVHGLPVSSFSLCVSDETGPAAGAVADPYRREVLSAVRGRGALRNGRPVRCSQATTLMGGIVLTELSGQTLWDGMAELMAALADAGCVTRIMGSNAFSVASVAAGRCVATVIGRFNPGDCLAGALIAAEAGAVVGGPSGPPREGEPLVCSAPGVVDALLPLVTGAAVT
ncbi:MAG TPA: inositol monophosphatase family protein [Gaiellaceae bacterium]|nr:inositol monophosphatase family protein [Gaiellaceae bacterium]